MRDYNQNPISEFVGDVLYAIFKICIGVAFAYLIVFLVLGVMESFVETYRNRDQITLSGTLVVVVAWILGGGAIYLWCKLVERLSRPSK